MRIWAFLGMFCALSGSATGSGLRELSRRLWSSVVLSPVWADYGGLAHSLCVAGLLSLAPIAHLGVPHDSYEWCWSLEADPEPRVWVPSCEGAAWPSCFQPSWILASWSQYVFREWTTMLRGAPEHSRPFSDHADTASCSWQSFPTRPLPASSAVQSQHLTHLRSQPPFAIAVLECSRPQIE